MRIFRRRFIALAAASAALGALGGLRAAIAADDNQRRIGLGFSLYGMRSLALSDALAACASIGYDAVELPVMPDWPGDSARLSSDARREFVAKLSQHGLRLSALMQNLPALGEDAQHAANIERFKRACELANDLKQGSHVPLIETVLGGKAGQFEAVKHSLASRLKDWVKTAQAAKITLAVKAHVNNTIQSPEQLLWLLEQVGSPYLTAVYDYSHFQLQSLKLAQTLKQLLPRTAFIHVKDTGQAQGGQGFLLPGEGSIDYGEYFRLLAASNYGGDVVVEVSAQVSSRPGYDPLAAARKCYNHLAPTMTAAGLRTS